MIDNISALPLFAIVLTVGIYQFALWCQKKTGFVLCNPILVSALLIIGILLITGIPAETYQAGTSVFSWLLTPATVCLAVPLYGQLKILKKNLPAILAGVAAGTFASLAVVMSMCLLFAFGRDVTVSMLPKSITTAIGLVLSRENGGIESLTSMVIMVTGILGNIMGPSLCKLLRLNDPISQGVAYGTASHVVGTSRAMAQNPLTGAVSSLSLMVAGILTVVIFPVICAFL